MSLEANLDRVIARQAELRDALNAPDLEQSRLVALSKEYAELTPVAEAAGRWRDTRAELAGLVEMLADPATDPEMKALAEDERTLAEERLEAVEQELRTLLLPRDATDERNVILEVRAGTGGDEAALFAGDLLAMYRRHASLAGWRFELLEGAETELGGIKEAVAQISGDQVYARLKFESGVHRVQRVPKTETQGRIHTSAATVAVLPEAEEVDLEINEQDLRVDTFRSQGAGGQHVNTTDSAVRITHLPTGVVVSCQEEKSQHKNRAKAIKILRARLLDAEQQRRASERAEARKVQVGSGDRSERIRTYNFPQGRITDHRINLTLYKLDRIIAGERLDELIDALVAEDRAARLAAMEEREG